jgi:hypothetical protein
VQHVEECLCEACGEFVLLLLGTAGAKLDEDVWHGILL